MKKTILFVVAVVLAGIFAAGCSDGGDTINIINKVESSSTNTSGTTTNMEQVFRIADTDSFSKKKVSLVYGANSKVEDDFYFPLDADTNRIIEDVPYVDFAKFYNTEFGISLEKKAADGIVIFNKPASLKYTVEFNEQKQTITFYDYDEFLKRKNAETLLDLVANRQYIKVGGNKFERYGKSITVDLKKYGIPMKIINGNVYIPLQTFCDVFNSKYVYNKTEIVYVSSMKNNVVSNEFYDENSGTDTRSQALVNFNYNELCLNLDLNYGLKEIHNITSFNAFFKETGLTTKLKGSANTTTSAILELVNNYFADFHSALNYYSYYSGKNWVRPDNYNSNPNYINAEKTMQYYSNKRAEVFNSKNYNVHYTDVTNSSNPYDYYESGDTAYITFDSFSDNIINYYNKTENGTKDLAITDVEDTIGLVIYAHQQINKNKTIKNVVIDLSCNGGGDVDALVYISSWFVGECIFNLKNSLTGAMCATTYNVDVNLDKNFDDTDTLKGLKNTDSSSRTLNLFCIISPSSFSCGNSLPTIFKDNGSVTLLGKKSGGGACCVYNTCTADSNIFQISSNYQMCSTKNGSYYQVDEGVDPDFVISDFANVYNREKLTEYIDTLK